MMFLNMEHGSSFKKGRKRKKDKKSGIWGRVFYKQGSHARHSWNMGLWKRYEQTSQVDKLIIISKEDGRLGVSFK